MNIPLKVLADASNALKTIQFADLETRLLTNKEVTQAFFAWATLESYVEAIQARTEVKVTE